jgi:uncharacterized membrane protein YfcA
MQFGWRVVLGSLIGFLGAAFGSVGGVGGGGIFVPMLTLIIGFDPKSSTATSKCKCFFAPPFCVHFSAGNCPLQYICMHGRLLLCCID